MSGKRARTGGALLVRNLFTLFGGETFAKLLGMVVFGFLSRTLLESRYGDLEFAVAAWFVLSLVLQAGLGPYAARQAAAKPEGSRTLAAQIAWIRAALLLVAWLGLVSFTWISGQTGAARVLLLLYGLVLLPMPLYLDWAFQARDEMATVAACSVLRQVILALGVFALVRGPEDAWIVPLADASGLGAAVIVQQALFRRRVGAISFWRHRSGSLVVFGEALPLTLSSLTFALRLFLPTLALGVLTTSALTARFAVGHRLVVAVHTFVWLYFFNLLPSIARLAAARDSAGYDRLMRVSLKVVGWASALGGSLGVVLAPALIPGIYGAGMIGGVRPFQVMLWALAAAFISGHFRYTLIGFNLRKQELAASAAGTITALAGCLVFGARLTPELAALIFVAAETATLLVAWVLAAVLVRPLPLLSFLWRPAIATAAVFGSLGLGGVESVPVAALWVAAGFALAAALLQRDLMALVSLLWRRQRAKPAPKTR